MILRAAPESRLGERRKGALPSTPMTVSKVRSSPDRRSFPLD